MKLSLRTLASLTVLAGGVTLATLSTGCSATPTRQSTGEYIDDAAITAKVKGSLVKDPVDKALDCVWGYGVGIDLTRRDLQIASRDIKRPWEVGKAFDASAPCGPLMPVSRSERSSNRRSSTPQVKAPCEPPPWRARSSEVFAEWEGSVAMSHCCTATCIRGESPALGQCPAS